MKRGVLFSALAVTLLITGMVLPRAASAKLTRAMLDADGWLSENGRYALFSAPVVCTSGETYALRATLSQAKTTSQAAGVAEGGCAGDLQVAVLTLTVLDGYQTLATGDARLCWNLTTRAGNVITSAKQECVRVTVAAPPLV